LSDGADDDGAGGGSGVADAVGGDVVDGVGCRLGCVEHEVAESWP